MIINTDITLDNNITVTRDAGQASADSMLMVRDGGSLTINHATLDGGGFANSGSLVFVRSRSLTINEGAVIRNNVGRSEVIYAEAYTGTETKIEMNGGEICNNNVDQAIVAIYSWAFQDEYVTFTMNGGSIHDNQSNWYIISTGRNDQKNRMRVNMNGGNIRNNQSAHYGVEIYNTDFVMQDGLIEQNTASAGGGGVMIHGDSAEAKITGGRITGNTGRDGGGLLLESGYLTLDKNANVSGNNTNGSGAGILQKGGTLDFVNGNITGNKVLPDSSCGGGGILVTGGTLNMSGGTVSNNQSDTGGGIEAYGNSTVNITGGTVSNNNAASYGGGVYVHDKTAVATISNATISGNTSPWASGIFIWNEGSVTINENTLITENQTTGNNHGGGIYLLGGTLKMTGGTVSKNTAPLDAGGIFISGGTATLEKDVKVTENSAGRCGGGISITGGTLTIDGATISKNHATDDGGGINLSDGNITLTSATVSENESGQRGGGIFSWGNATLNIEKGTFITKNKSVQGGGIDSCDHPLTIDGATISENEAERGSGISVWDNGEVTVKGNTLIKENRIVGQGTDEAAGTIYIYGSGAAETRFNLESGRIINNKAIGDTCASIAVIGSSSKAIAMISGGEISGNTNESGKRQGIRFFKDGDQNGALKLSGTLTIKDEIFLNDDQDPAAKVEVIDAFEPTEAIKIDDTSWTNYRTIVSYVQGQTAQVKDFIPASNTGRKYIIKDGQELKSMNKLKVIFREKDATENYGEAYVIAKEKIDEKQIPSINKKGYEIVGWQLETNDRNWNFDKDTVTEDSVLNPVWKLKLPRGKVRAVDGKKDIHEGTPVKLEAVLEEEVEGISYQYIWMKDGKEIENRDQSRMTSATKYLTVTEAGTYSVKVIASDTKDTTKAVEIGSVKVTESKHAFGEWKTVKEATETEEGLEERVCTICGIKEQRTIPLVEKKEEQKPSDKEEPKKEEKIETPTVTGEAVANETVKTENKGTAKTVKTGDNLSLRLYAGTMMSAAFAGILVLKRKKKD